MSEVKLNREIHDVVVLDNEWMCNEHPDTILEFHHMSNQYEYYACPKCGNYIKVDQEINTVLNCQCDVSPIIRFINFRVMEGANIVFLDEFKQSLLNSSKLIK